MDFFKSINDQYGHDKGDEALRAISGAIRDAVEPADLVARIGGEEFSVFIPHAGTAAALERSERIRRAIAATRFSPAGGAVVPLSASVGGVSFAGGVTFNDIYRAADQQMYQAKSHGRNQVFVLTEPLPRAA